MMAPGLERLPEAGQITEVLRRWNAGDPAAAETALGFLYDRLRGIARRQLRRERPSPTLQATGLVHEAFLRLARGAEVRFRDRAHFLNLFACVMRRVLIDHARRKRTLRHGADPSRLPSRAAGFEPAGRSADLLALDEALTRLAARDPAMADVVQLRFFGGLSLEETAQALGTSAATISRRWRLARAWLLLELGGAHA